MPLHVGFDISSLPYNRGVSRYTSNLVRGLYAQSEEVVLRLFGSSFRQRAALQAFVADETPCAHAVFLPHPVKIMNVLWNRLHRVSPESFLGNIDVFHSWEMQPPLKSAALVSTIHDLAMIRYPKTADPYVYSMNKASWNHLKKEGKAMIAVSESTKKDVVELLEIEPERVHVVYEALPKEAKLRVTTVRRNTLLLELRLTKPYIFFIGTLEPRKNLHRLIQAWRPLKKEIELVIAGAQGWDSVKQEQGLHVVGSVNNEQLAALYSGAEALTYPSLYEGFGLPILDGFYHGVPVLTSNVSSMPEVAGDAAVLVDPLRVESITRGIEEVLHHRKKYVDRGKERVKKFSSWDDVAKKTIQVYKKAVAYEYRH